MSLILSPHYYWAKKSSVVFKNRQEAKKVAASMFDLDQGYLYEVYESDEGYVFVAYNPSEILARLTAQGIDPKKVKQVYLSQSFFQNMTEALIVDEETALAQTQGVVVILDACYTQAKQKLSSWLKTPSERAKKVRIEGIGSFEWGHYRGLMIAASVLIVTAFILEFVSVQMRSSGILAKQEYIREKYHLPATQFQLQSILKDLRRVNQEQSSLRKSLYELRQNKSLQANLRSLTYDKKGLTYKPKAAR